MRSILVTAVLLFSLTVLAGASAAQSDEVTVGKIDFPQRAWGLQEIKFPITNNSGYFKYIAVQSDISFEESYSGAQRLKQSNFLVPPNEETVINPMIDIPGNYGKASCWIRLYDVVDTLDDISLGNLLFEQEFRLTFRPPEAIQPYRQERLTVPPLTGETYDWDNELARLTILLLNKGKTVEEIATMTGTSVENVKAVMDTMVMHKYARLGAGGEYILNVPVITLDEAKEGRAFADELSDQLAAQVTKNLEGFPLLIDSLVASGAFSGDSSNFYEGGAMLYQRYPLVAGMLLWYDLGHRFITDGARMMIYRPGVLCNPNIGEFMYLVEGGDYFNGTHYFNPTVNVRYVKVDFGDQVPVIHCTPHARSLPGPERKGDDWIVDSAYAPQPIVFDTLLINHALRNLRTGFPEILQPAVAKLGEIDQKYGHEKLRPGTRFWFWNLVATHTVNKLVDSGALAREGNGQFSLQSHDLTRTRKAGKK